MIFDCFIGKDVKALYQDGIQQKAARGILESVDKYFIRINGSLGIIIIHRSLVLKMSLMVKE